MITNYNEYKKHEQLLENIAQAKAILRNKNIPEDNENYQKILKATNKDAYTGIITRIVFKDNIDIDEALALYGDLKSNKINVADITKLDYADILDVVYKEEESDVEFCFKYENYYVYHVKTYDGGLTICSPAWCLKTKTNWDNYIISRKGNQFVIIHENAVKNNKSILSTPNTYYGDKYTNTTRPEIRYGITIYPKGNYDYFDDDNKSKYGTNRPTILNNIVDECVKWLNDNNITKKINRLTADDLIIKDAILDIFSETFYRSFDNGIYSEDSTLLNTIYNTLTENMNMSISDIKQFFIKNKDIILSDEDFISNCGSMDVLLYSLYGNEIQLSGILLIERQKTDYSYKYYYGFHKYYWGRKLIEQSFNNVTTWFKEIGKSFIYLIGIKDLEGYGLYTNGFAADCGITDLNITEDEFTKYCKVEMVKNGSIVTFNVDKFKKDYTDIDAGLLKDSLIEEFDATLLDDGRVLIKFLDDKYVQGEEE